MLPKVFSPIPGRPRDMQRRLALARKKFVLKHPERGREIDRLLQEARQEESAASPNPEPNP
jgi:hypothetical protein